MRKSLRMLESVLVGNEASAQEVPQTVWMQSDNGRSEVPSFDQQQIESDDNVNEHVPKGKRGKTNLEHVWRMPKNRRIKVRSNLLRQPVGLEAKTFSNYCGVVVRADCPLNYSNWSKVPRGTKRDIINHMKPKPNSNTAATSTKMSKPNTEPTKSAKPNDAMKVKSVVQTSRTMGKACVPNVVPKAQVKTHVGLGMPDIATAKMKSKNAQVIMQKDDGAQVLKEKVVGSRPSFKSPVGSSPAVIGHRHVPSSHSNRGLRGAEYDDIASRFINELNASTTPTFNDMVHRRAASSYSSCGFMGAES